MTAGGVWGKKFGSVGKNENMFLAIPLCEKMQSVKPDSSAIMGEVEGAMEKYRLKLEHSRLCVPNEKIFLEGTHASKRMMMLLQERQMYISCEYHAALFQ